MKECCTSARRNNALSRLLDKDKKREVGYKTRTRNFEIEDEKERERERGEQRERCTKSWQRKDKRKINIEILDTF
jgi:hypothetical protein